MIFNSILESIKKSSEIVILKSSHKKLRAARSGIVLTSLFKAKDYETKSVKTAVVFSSPKPISGD